MKIPTLCFLFGAILLSAALFGGDLIIEKISLPQIGIIGRIACGFIGSVFLGMAIYFYNRDRPDRSEANNTTNNPKEVKDIQKEEAKKIKYRNKILSKLSPDNAKQLSTLKDEVKKDFGYKDYDEEFYNEMIREMNKEGSIHGNEGSMYSSE